jgi:peptide/nickel transport system permease protein
LIRLAARLGQVVPTLLLVSVLVFGLQELMPGDPAIVLAGPLRDPIVVAQIRAKLVLDQPIPVQYLHWLGNVLQGDLGFSWRIGQPVAHMIEQKLPVTLQLSAMGFCFALLIGVPAGVISAVKRDTVWDWAVNVIGLAGISVPNFWIGILLILAVCVDLGWLPSSGYTPLTEDWRMSLATTILPAFVLGNNLASTLMRHTRSAMLSALDQDYIRTAPAKGLREGTVIVRHALRNALIPIVTLGGAGTGRAALRHRADRADLQIPGFGKLVVDAVFDRDYPVVQAVVLVTAVLYIALNLVADVLYVVINPRLRTG